MGNRVKIVVSDLHLGAGCADKGNRLEDFGSEAEFCQLVDALAQESQAQGMDAELVFAGDAIEFLQVPILEPTDYDPTHHYSSQYYRSTSEVDSVRKIKLVILGHATLFACLRRFIQAASPRRQITFIKGNHDVNLHWRGVQESLRQAIGASSHLAACLHFEERCLKREGLYIEHGNQYAERVNRFPDFEEPHDVADPDQLYLPPGSCFVFNFFNSVEWSYYWVDGIKPLTALIWYMFALDLGFALRATIAFLRELPALFWGSLSLEQAQAQAQAQRSLGRDLGADCSPKDLARHTAQKEALYAEVCRATTQFATAPVSRTVSGGARARMMASAMAEEHAQRTTLVDIARQKATQEDAQVIIFGHTHAAEEHDLGNGAVYLNSGTWTWSRDFMGEDSAAWKRLIKDPAQFTSECRLTYVRIDYGADDTPVARLEEIHVARPQRTRWQWLFGSTKDHRRSY